MRKKRCCFNFMQRMIHEDWVESIHIESVSAFRIVVQIHFLVDR
jgi:hypothetical protein